MKELPDEASVFTDEQGKQWLMDHPSEATFFVILDKMNENGLKCNCAMCCIYWCMLQIGRYKREVRDVLDELKKMDFLNSETHCAITYTDDILRELNVPTDAIKSFAKPVE